MSARGTIGSVTRRRHADLLYDLVKRPLILIDVRTREGVVGRSYLEPYLKKAVRYVGPAILDLAEAFRGRQLAPLDLYPSPFYRTRISRQPDFVNGLLRRTFEPSRRCAVRSARRST